MRIASCSTSQGEWKSGGSDNHFEDLLPPGWIADKYLGCGLCLMCVPVNKQVIPSPLPPIRCSIFWPRAAANADLPFPVLSRLGLWSTDLWHTSSAYQPSAGNSESHTTYHHTHTDHTNILHHIHTHTNITHHMPSHTHTTYHHTHTTPTSYTTHRHTHTNMYQHDKNQI